MARIVWNGTLIPGVGILAKQDNASQLLGMTGNSGVITCPGVPARLYAALSISSHLEREKTEMQVLREDLKP